MLTISYSAKFKKDFKVIKGDVDIISNGEIAYGIFYDEDRKLFSLKKSPVSEGEDAEFYELSAWLFDDKSDERDIKAICYEFTEAVMKDQGVKAKGNDGGKITVPKKNSASEDINLDEFTARFLDIYNDYKEEYKKNVSKYSEFLYDEFYRTFGSAAVKKAVKGTKKQSEKMAAFFENSYNYGDKAVRAVIIYSIFATVMKDDDELKTAVLEAISKSKYLVTAIRGMLRILSRSGSRKKYEQTLRA